MKLKLQTASCGCCLEVANDSNTVATICDPEQFVEWLEQYYSLKDIIYDTEEIMPPIGTEIIGWHGVERRDD